MKATILLADHADAVNGKLYINGGGWTVTGPQPIPSAIALIVHVPWDQTNTKHTLLLELLDSDGNAILNPADDAPVRIELPPLEVGRPVGVKPGMPLSVPVAVNLGPIQLAPDGQYVWQLSIDGHADEDWRLVFSTRPNPPQALAA